MNPEKRPFDTGEYLLPSKPKTLFELMQQTQKQRRAVLAGKKIRRQTKPVVRLPSRITIRDLAVALGVKLPKVIRALQEMKVFTSVDQKIPFYTASKVAAMCGYQVEKLKC